MQGGARCMSEFPLLSRIGGPKAVRQMDEGQLPALAAELRQRILQVVSRRGGHLASNLGSVELTVALLHCFDLAEDAVVWDTGHQAYSYKLLTGRNELFEQLRAEGGCSGFLHRQESVYDHFGAGHAGTAISAALGFAAVRDHREGRGRVIAVVGDGALGSGVALEGLNSIIETTDDFILILNDNRMSIAPNVGAISQYLNRTISGLKYRKLRRLTSEVVDAIPVVGQGLRRWFRRVMMAAKGLLTPGAVFEELGLTYFGPLDGHDLQELTRTFSAVRSLRKPLVLHVLTEKGRGYPHAEKAPELYHGMGEFDLESGQALVPPEPAPEPPPRTFSAHLGDALERIMAKDHSVVAITAGMCHGTGLAAVRKRFPERLYDVGIAEEHAVVFAAGMAAAGMKPVVAIYATFMHRAFDYVYHDVLLQNLPVVFCLDRAGVVDDGPTHHGILDLSWWRGLPELSVLQPADAPMLETMLGERLAAGAPAVIRYPKSLATPLEFEGGVPSYRPGRAAVLRKGDNVALWALGREVNTAFQVADMLAGQGVEATVVDVRSVVPLDEQCLLEHARQMPIVTIEDHVCEAGLGAMVAEALAGEGGVRLLQRGWPREPVACGTCAGLRRTHRLDTESLAEDIAAFVRR